MTATEDLALLQPSVFDEFFFNSPQGREKYTRQARFIDDIATGLRLPKDILDLGCGTGAHLSILAERGYRGTGVDLREDMVQYAKGRGLQGFDFIAGDMRDIDPGRKFPLISILFTSLNYLSTEEDLEQTLGNVHRLLAEDGACIIDTRHAENRPRGVRIKTLNEYTEIGRWHKENAHDLRYEVIMAKAGQDGFMFHEHHRLRFTDPFYLEEKLRNAGYSSVSIYDDFSDGEFTAESKGWKPTIVARP